MLSLISDFLNDLDWPLLAALLAGLGLLIFFLFGKPGIGRRRPRAGAPFRVRDPYVIDGDTLAAGDTRIRIHGMDAPETGQPQGNAATRHMRALVSGRVITVFPLETDVYGRLVARVSVGGVDIGARMVADGYAVVPSQSQKLYGSLERRARRARKGLWRNGRIQDPKAWRQANS